MVKRRGSKIFTEEKIKAIFRSMEEGNSMRKACEENGVKYNSFFEYIGRYNDLYEQYARAKQKGQDARFENMLDYVENSKADPFTKKLYIDTLKWQLAKQQPKKYGEKLEVEGKNIAPTIITIKRAND